MSLLDLVQQHVGSSEIQQISQQIGADPATTEAAVQAALPMLVGGMANTAQQPGGASAIQQAMGSHGGMLGNLGAMLGAAGLGDGGGLLGKILGGHQATVQQGVSQASGLDPEKTRQLLMVLAPIVMAALARRHGNASHEEIGGALQHEAQAAQDHAQRTSPQLGGLLGKILSHVQMPRT